MKQDDSRVPALLTPAFAGFVSLNLFAYSGFYLLWPALGPFLDDFGYDQAAIGQIFTAFTVATIAVRVFSGWLTCRFSPLALIQIGCWAVR